MSESAKFRDRSSLGRLLYALAASAFVVLLVAASCESRHDLILDARQDDGRTTVPQAGRDAREIVVVDGRSLSLSASIWRDCMPSPPPSRGCHPLAGTIAVTADDGKPFPGGLHIDRVWLIQKGETWETSAIEEQDEDDPSFTDSSGVYRNRPSAKSFRIVLRNGPDWEPGSSAEVIVRLADEIGRHRFLRKAGQTVARIS